MIHEKNNELIELGYCSCIDMEEAIQMLGCRIEAIKSEEYKLVLKLSNGNNVEILGYNCGDSGLNVWVIDRNEL